MKLNWQAFTSKDRTVAIEELKGAIMAGGGYIVGFQLFSDLAMSLTIEVEENRIAQLLHSLVNVVAISAAALDHIDQDSRKEWLLFLHVTFIKGKGFLETVIPEVPG